MWRKKIGADIIAGLHLIADWQNIFFIFCGVCAGITLGAIPGLTATMGIALIIPITFYMSPVASISMLIGAYKGGLFGGSISAIMIGTPGTDSASATVEDGYPLAKQGKAGKALAMAVYASVAGDLLGLSSLIVLAPLIATVALKIGPGDFAAIMIFSLTMVAGISGKSMTKGVLSCVFGLLFGVIGMDPIIGLERLTFGIAELQNGISLIAFLIGLFAIPEILTQMEQKITYAEPLLIKSDNPADDRVSWKELKENLRFILLGGGIGIIVGAIPGIGPTVAAWMSYGQARNISKHPEKFGHGALEGVAAPESGNNACCGGALIPMFTLGVPGSGTVAILMGAFIIQGIFPGPMIFKEHGPIVYAIFAGLIVSNIILLFLALLAIRRMAAPLCRAPKQILFPLILALCFVGAFGVTLAPFDMTVMLATGILAYLMRKTGFPASPMLLGFILGPIGERAMRQFLIVAGNDVTQIFRRPLAVIFIALTVLITAGIVRSQWKKARVPTVEK